jgi:hypothetical protein
VTAVDTEEKQWSKLTPDERRAARVAGWRAPAGVVFESAEAEADYRQRVDIFVDAVEVKKVPERVPILASATFMPAHLAGATPYEVMYEPEKLFDVTLRFVLDYRPDYYFTPVIIGSGQIFEILDVRQVAWPGHGVAKESGYQYIEGEFMRDEDYQALIDDPTDFWLRRYLPRALGALEPLQRIPAFTDLWEIVLVTAQMIPFGAPDVQQALEALAKAGREALAWAQKIGGFDATAQGKGYASIAGGISKAPFDILADTLRGTRSTMLDMHRRPELILAAVERLTPLAIKQGVAGADMNKNPVVFMPLHKGADGFMSDEQFQRFYWPSLKAVCLGLIEQGCIPFLFCEGGYDSRIEHLQDLPTGTTFCLFDKTDMVRAKKLLGGRVCIGGNVPSSMLLTGTAEDVKAYCKKLIDEVAPGGGYVMSFGTAMDEGKADTVHAMIDFTREYGVYG